MPTKTVIVRANLMQVVPLPNDVAFPDDVQEIEIIKVGNSRVISPVGHRWDSYFSRPSRVSDDFMSERDQGVFEVRDPL